MMQNNPRKPLFACLMSFVLPGFGQLYNGEANKGIWIFLGFAFLSIPGGAAIAIYLHGTAMLIALLVSLLSTIAIWLYGIVDAGRCAAMKQTYQPLAWQSSGMYVLTFVLCNALALPIIISEVRNHEVEAFRIPSASMSPTLLPGDFIFVDKRYNCPGCKYSIKRGDVVILTNPNDRTIYYIKRIIGLPGDRLQISGHTILVNGKSLSLQETMSPTGTQITEGDAVHQWQVLWSHSNDLFPELSLTVSAGQVFVLGDNRSNSVDSRVIGTIPLQDVLGKARRIWLSTNGHEVRWNRLGQGIEPENIFP